MSGLFFIADYAIKSQITKIKMISENYCELLTNLNWHL